jgi:hypothetical protein
VDPTAPAPLGKLIEKALPISASPRRPAVDPYAYAPTEPCLRALSPLGSPFGTRVDVAAETALCSAFSDGLLAYRLSPGDRLCAPGFHHEQTFLPMFLSAWLSGAAFVHISEEHLVSTPPLLDIEPITVLGLSPALASSLRAVPRRPGDRCYAVRGGLWGSPRRCCHRPRWSGRCVICLQRAGGMAP